MIKAVFRRLIKPYLKIIKQLTDTIGIPTIQGEGRPDIPTTLSPQNQTLVANAANAAKFISTDGAGVGAYEWQLINGVWTPTVADTGEIRITDTNAADVVVRREGGIVFVQIDRWSGTRIWLPKGFRPAYNVVTVEGTNDADESIGKLEVAGFGAMYRFGSDQSYPWYATDTKYWQTRSDPLKAAYRSNSGMKALLTFPANDPYPESLDVDAQSRDLLPVTVDRTITNSDRVTGSDNYTANWQGVNTFSNEAITFPEGMYVNAGGNLTFPFNTTPPTNTATVLHIRGTAKVGADYGADALNGAAIHYTLDGTAYIDSGIICAGHTDGETDAVTYTVPVADIQGMRLVKSTGVLAVGACWIGAQKA